MQSHCINRVCKNRIFSFALTSLGIVGLTFSYSSYGGEFIGGVVLLPIFYFTFRAYNIVSFEKTDLYVPAGILSIIYAATLVIGVQLDIQSFFSISLKTLIAILLLATEIFPFLCILIKKTEAYVLLKERNCKVLKISFLFIVIFWIMAYLALFPGVYTTDAPYWYYEFNQRGVSISSQWSPIYCGFFYLFMRIGKDCFDNFSLGFAIFSFIQMSFSLFVVWKILLFIDTHLNKRFVIGTALFFMIPTHVILALSSAQDSVFTACFAMVLLFLLEYCIDKEKFVAQRAKVLGLFSWALLMCLIRNNGLYVVLLLLVVALVLKAKKKMLIALGSVIVVVMIYQGPIYNICGIQKGTAIREMLSLPLQQMAYVYNNCDLPSDEKQEAERFVSEEGWQMYNGCISDSVKGNLDVEAFNRNKSSFVKLYMTWLLRYPFEYIEATGMQTFILWYPNKNWPDARTWHPFLDIICYDTSVGLESDFYIVRKSLFPQYELLLEKLFGYGEPCDGYGGRLEMCFSSIPIVGTLCQAGVYSWILLYLFLFSLSKKNKRVFLVLSPALGVWITVFLSPVIMYRYCAPFIFTAPLYTSAAILLKDSK